ncbi:NitT/TauT family transport system substrate-binding protein [Alteribacillus bidgolensis]|uniref:NitT/TauT family transport system substrate-binding protein n=2 Tax=Alteribacillus bidgolensis TaxID=930129 RepID=A0A1G8ENP1_9BACI|nr:ABC transporter substrate-binding protein [Alteribacillus bidgolensis]SDH71516.1 NitT/TauT family transport system substrate-binding protein [Alteribacillus bidgolensis]
MKMKVLSALLCFFIFIGPLTACSFQQEDSETIRLAEVTRSIFYAPLYVAMEEGFFEEENLNIELTTTWGGDKTMTSLLSDGSDVALVGAETSIYVNSQEPAEPIINFAMLTQSDGTFLMARNETAETFDWENLKGSTFLGQRKGGMPQMAGEFVLKKNNIDPHRDLDLIQNIDFANIANAYASGTGDYVQLFEPQATMFEQKGLGHIVASFGEESGAVPYTVFMAKEGYLEEKGDTLESFTRAIYKAQQWIYESSPEEIAAALTPYFDDTSEEIIADSAVRYRDQESYATSPVLTEEAWDNLQDIMEEAGELPERSDYEKFVDNQWAEKVMNE